MNRTPYFHFAYTIFSIIQSIAISNPRYRRSRSAGQVWIDHQPKTPVVTNTIMQPSNLKKRRSVTKVNEKDFADPKCSNYALTHQEQDTDGDLETKIYKVCIYVRDLCCFTVLNVNCLHVFNDFFRETSFLPNVAGRKLCSMMWRFINRNHQKSLHLVQ